MSHKSIHTQTLLSKISLNPLKETTPTSPIILPISSSPSDPSSQKNIA